MNNLTELIKYILLTYPKLEELSKPRLVKLIYLIDWKHSVEYGNQYTKIRWIFNHYGPYVNDIIDTMKENPNVFDVQSRQNPYGGITDRFRIKKTRHLQVQLDSNVKNIADFLIEKTSPLSWSNFISIVYSTYPIKTNLKYSMLDLERLSTEYKVEKNIMDTAH